MKNKIQIYTSILGLVLFIICFLIPAIPNQGLQPAGFISIFINPILGIVGIIFSIKNKGKLWLIPNILLILSFFILMFLGYIL